MGELYCWGTHQAISIVIEFISLSTNGVSNVFYNLPGLPSM